MNKVLYIVRGLPGSGKSTFAKTLSRVHYEADMFFEQEGEYKFDPSKIGEAHEWCQSMVMMAMKREESKIAVSNTFTQEWEMKPYFNMAEKYGYIVHTIVVENRHGGKNIHDVPDNVITKMKNRFEINL